MVVTATSSRSMRRLSPVSVVRCLQTSKHLSPLLSLLLTEGNHEAPGGAGGPRQSPQSLLTTCLPHLSSGKKPQPRLSGQHQVGGLCIYKLSVNNVPVPECPGCWVMSISRTPAPCGMPKGESSMSLLAGSSLNITWHLGYPHRGQHWVSQRTFKPWYYLRCNLCFIQSTPPHPQKFILTIIC